MRLTERANAGSKQVVMPFGFSAALRCRRADPGADESLALQAIGRAEWVADFLRVLAEMTGGWRRQRGRTKSSYEYLMRETGG